jgi:hypothetical protein
MALTATATPQACIRRSRVALGQDGCALTSCIKDSAMPCILRRARSTGRSRTIRVVHHEAADRVCEEASSLIRRGGVLAHQERWPVLVRTRLSTREVTDAGSSGPCHVTSHERA